jgi:hypothetical protein
MFKKTVNNALMERRRLDFFDLVIEFFCNFVIKPPEKL